MLVGWPDVVPFKYLREKFSGTLGRIHVSSLKCVRVITDEV